MEPIQNVRVFRKRSPFSRMFGSLLRGSFTAYMTVKNLFSKANSFFDRDEYERQAPEASRMLELVVENLLGFGMTEPKKFKTIHKIYSDWKDKYFTAQRETLKQDHYLFYTQDDLAIPFRPDADILYAFLPAQILLVGRKASKHVPERKLKYLANCFIELNKMAADVFYAYPAKIPRFTDHNRLSLKVVQSFDAPINSCPSLHIGYSFLMYNISKQVLDFPRREPDCWEALEALTLGMASSVLHLKQHHILDVAFGMLASQMIFERRFKKHQFDNLLWAFPELQREHPDIPYDKIQYVYHRGQELRLEHKDLTSIVGAYVNEKGFHKRPPDSEPHYYDENLRQAFPVTK